MSRLYCERDAGILGRRLVCYAEGHRLKFAMDVGVVGGVLGGVRDGRGEPPAACDEIKCERCDVVFTATYPPIGQEAK